MLPIADDRHADHPHALSQDFRILTQELHQVGGVPRGAEAAQWNNAGMGFLSDYFSAPSDEAAARVIDDDVDLREPPYDVLQMKNLIPEYHLAPVEAFLTGRSAEAVKENPRNGMLLAQAEDYQVVVVTVSDELTASLAAASSERLAEAAESWSHFEDFQGTDTSGLVGFLGDLASLARRAMARYEHLYCMLCVLQVGANRGPTRLARPRAAGGPCGQQQGSPHARRGGPGALAAHWERRDRPTGHDRGPAAEPVRARRSGRRICSA
jgi:hypothetical protein